jgi:Protein of unknown function (DUF2934)
MARVVSVMKESLDSLNYPLPSHEQIAARAHRIYLERGCQPGYEVDDWLQAEYELMQLPVRKIAELEPPKSDKGKSHRKSIIHLVRAAVLFGGTGLTQLGQLGNG